MMETQTQLKPLPLTPLEAFLYQCNTPNAPMVIRVILRLTGKCEQPHCVETMQRAIRRHPLLCSRLQRLDGKLYWIPGEPEPTRVRTESGSIFDVQCGPMATTIDLTQSAALHTSITIMDDGIYVVLDAHHAATDGNGMRQMITDWLCLYHTQITGAACQLALVNSSRLSARDQFPQPASIAPISFKDAVRNFLVTIRGKTVRWASRDQSRHSQSSTSASHCVELILNNQQADQLRQRLSAWKVHINDLVMVCGMSTFARMATPGAMHHRVTALNPVELRRPSDRDLPATNRFGFAFMRRMRSECLDPVAILRGIQSEMQYVRSNYIGVEFIRGLTTASKIPGGINFFRRLNLFIPSLQATCLGDVTRGFRRQLPWQDGFPVGGELRLEAATGFAPHAENVPVSISTCETNQRIILAIQSSSQYLTLDQSQSFAASLLQQLCSFPMPDEDSQASAGITSS